MGSTKLRFTDVLIVGGGALFLVGSLLDWVSVQVGDIEMSGGSAFDHFFTGIVPWLLLLGAAIVTLLLAGRQLKAASAPWDLILLAATVLGAALVVVRFISPGLGADLDAHADVGRGFGLVLCALGGVVSAAGGVLRYVRRDADRRESDDRDDQYDQYDSSTYDR